MTQLASLSVRITGNSDSFVRAAMSSEDAANKLKSSIAGTSGSGTGPKGGVTGATGSLGKAFSKVSQSRSMRLLPMQFSQVAQQAAAGTPVMRALTIQAADIGLAFGVVGTIIGTVATVALPSIIAAFSGGEEAAGQLETALEDIQAAAEGLEGSLAILEMSAEDLSSKYGLAAASVREFAVELANMQLAQANDRLRASVEIADDFVTEFGRGSDALDKFAAASERARDRTMGGINSAIIELSETLGVSEDQAINVSRALGELGNATTLDETNAAADQLSAALTDAGIEANDLPPELRDMIIELRSAQIEAAELAGLMERVAQATADAAAGSAGMTMGGGMSQLMGGMTGEQLLPPAASVLDEDEDKATGGRGKSAAVRDEETFKKDMERLQEQLATELELEQQMHDQRGEMLARAKEQELLTQEEYDKMMERENKRHSDAMTAIDAYRHGSGVAQMGQFMGEMAGAFATGNERMMQIGKAFGAAEALINAWRTYTQVMADPSLPWFAKIPAAVSLLGSAMGAVNAIKGVGKGGSGQRAVSGGGASPAAIGGGGGGGGPEAAGGGGSQGPRVSLTLMGNQGFTRAQVVQIAEAINDSADEGQELIQIQGRR